MSRHSGPASLRRGDRSFGSKIGRSASRPCLGRLALRTRAVILCSRGCVVGCSGESGLGTSSPTSSICSISGFKNVLIVAVLQSSGRDGLGSGQRGEPWRSSARKRPEPRSAGLIRSGRCAKERFASALRASHRRFAQFWIRPSARQFGEAHKRCAESAAFCCAMAM